MATILELSFILSTLVSVTVSSDVFGLVGHAVQLNTQAHVPEFTTFAWVFNETKNIVIYLKKHKDTKNLYGGRVEFNNETYSLTLKNLQKNDSGVYKAKTSGQEVKVVANFTLSVLDPVETPVTDYQLKNDTCNITVSCKSQNLFINSSCYNETCERPYEISHEGITLSLFMRGSSIICNHSNPVSWKEKVLDTRTLLQHCLNKGTTNAVDPRPLHVDVNILTIIIIIIAVILIIIFTTIFFYCRHRKRSAGAPQCDNTVYAEVQKSADTIMPEQPCTVYSVVGTTPQIPSNGGYSQTMNSESQQPSTSVDRGIANTYESVLDTRQPTMPDTIYATVSKPNTGRK